VRRAHRRAGFRTAMLGAAALALVASAIGAITIGGRR
jgi:hypothetical protein